MAKGLLAVERDGSSGTPKAYVVDEGNNEVNLTPEDQEEFDTALERELRKARDR